MGKSGGMGNTANDLAPVIAQMIAAQTDANGSRDFKRALVSSVYECYADVLVEGNSVLTRNVIIGHGVKMKIGDQVLVLSIGDSGTNLMILANITRQMPIGHKMVFSWRSGVPATGWNFPQFPYPAGKDGIFTLNDTWNWWRPQDPQIQMRGHNGGWFRATFYLRMDDWNVNNVRGLRWQGSIEDAGFMTREKDGRWTGTFVMTKYCVGGEQFYFDIYNDGPGQHGLNITVEIERIA
jgi:hypothetical protein